MDKYFVIEITKTKDSDAYATLITIKDTRDEAEALYCQIVASALINPAVEYAQVSVNDIRGNKAILRVIDRRVAPEPEPPVIEEEPIEEQGEPIEG